jgi:hypothetical protein
MALLAAVGIGAWLLSFRLSTIPGLHGDEAWAGLRAEAILRGARPMLGMNAYTGPVQQYLLAPLLYSLGTKVAVLRALTAGLNLASLCLYYVLLGRWFGRAVASAGVLVLVAMPFFTAYSRIANEVFALNPLLALSGMLLLGRRRSGEQGGRRTLLLHVAGGMCLGLGVWNHLIFLSVPVALLVAALFRHGATLLRQPGIYAAGYGFLLALTPRVLWQFSGAGELALRNPATAAGGLFNGLTQRLCEWPVILLKLVHGDLLFQRFAGEVLFPTPNLLWPVLLGSVVLMSWRGLRQPARRSSSELALTVFALALLLVTAVLCPSNADRYFLLPLYVTPVYVAYACSEVLRSCILNLNRAPWSRAFSSSGPQSGQDREKGRGEGAKRTFPAWPVPLRSVLTIVVALLLCLLLVFQLTRVYVNYFVAQARSHGRASTFGLGSQPETSNHFIRTDALYADLVRRDIKEVFAEFFIALPLQFHDLGSHQFAAVHTIDSEAALERARQQPLGHAVQACAVVYASGLRRLGPAAYRGFRVISSDGHFVVMAPGPP